jgi:hypothetical protein
MIGDTVFLLGVGALTWFMVGLLTGWSYAPTESTQRSGGRMPVPAPSRI